MNHDDRIRDQCAQTSNVIDAGSDRNFAAEKPDYRNGK
jgi:hypothetical protein